jgi:halocyanin-like protein
MLEGFDRSNINPSPFPGRLEFGDTFRVDDPLDPAGEGRSRTVPGGDAGGSTWTRPRVDEHVRGENRHGPGDYERNRIPIYDGTQTHDAEEDMTGKDTGGTTRRGVLRGAAGGAAAALSLSVAGTAGAAEDAGIGDWLSDTSNYEGTIQDLRGNDEVRIEVGVDTGFLFGPPAVRIDPGTTVTWEWTGQGGEHNVHAIEGASFESDLKSESGATYNQTIEETGIITYQCDPHARIGMKAVLVVGDIQVGGGGQVRPDFGGWLEGVDGGYRDARGSEEVTVEVGASGNGGNLAFAPAGLWVDPGTTILFEWTGEGGRHNVVAREGPADLDSGSAVSTTGVEYEFTVEEGGITNYVCEPHETVGMKGAIAVGEDVPTVETGGDGEDGASGGGPAFRLPGGDPGVAIMLAVFGITGAAALSVLATELRGAFAVEDATEPEPIEESVVREIGHEEFSPTGTASLIAIYFLILVGLWFFMYFVEFLGNGPTIIG